MKKIGVSRYRVISLLLAAACMVYVFSACTSASGDANGEGTADTTAKPDGITASEETEPDVLSVLGSFESTDYNGASFDIWTSNVINGSLALRQAPEETMNAEYINDALHTRDRLLEEKYKISINYTLVEPDAEFQLFNKASKVILAGDDEIDLIFGNMQVYAKNFIEHELILDINKIPEIDLTKEWWHQTAVRDLEVAGTMYFATGDITPRYVFSVFIMLFNKGLFDDYNYEYPYDAVRNGTWTIDGMLGLIKGTFRDLNGDNKSGLEDFYGFSNEGWVYPMYNGLEEKAMTIGSGEPVINCVSEKAIDKIMKLGELFSLDDVFYRNVSTQYDFSDIFEADRALLCTQTAANLYMLTDMETDFGVLPLPKYDENQDGYYSFVNGYAATAIMIPKTVSDTPMVGTLTEAMAAASRYTSTPAAYEVTLLTKQTRDEDSVEMLRITAEGAMYDLCAFFNWGNVYSTVGDLIITGGKNAASRIQSLTNKAMSDAQRSLDLFTGGN